MTTNPPPLDPTLARRKLAREIAESIARGQFQAAARRVDAARRGLRDLAGQRGPLADDARANLIAYGQKWAEWMDERIESYPAGGWIAPEDDCPPEVAQQHAPRRA